MLQIAGVPTGYLIIEPSPGVLALRFPRSCGRVPDLSPYRYFSTSTVGWNGENWLEVEVTVGADLLEAYPVLCAVADRIQLEHATFDDAVVDALATYRELLAGLGRMTDEEEVGLFGELLVLRHLVLAGGAAAAMSAWSGPSAEEHDFSLAMQDVEVKTTTAEARRHWISDLYQLVPSPSRDLFLISIQLTTGGDAATTLPELISDLRDSLDPDSQVVLDARLRETRWRPEQEVLHLRRFRLRSAPATFRVSESFPALTPSALVAAGLDVARFPKVTYLLDLVGIEAASPPAELAALAKEALP